MEAAKILCVPFKDAHSTDKVRRRILKRMKKLERKSFNSPFVKNLDKSWTPDIHAVVSNSSYIGFLLKDGRVCRMKASSVPNPVSNNQELLNYSQRSDGNSLQVLSDAEFARQLQSQYDQENEARRTSYHYAVDESDIVRGLSNNSLSPYISLNTLPTPINSNFNSSPATATPLLSSANVSAQSANTSAPAPSVQSASSAPSTTSEDSGRKEVKFDLGSSQRKKEENPWPEMGQVEWLKQNSDSSINDNRFVSIVSLHSEFLLVGATTGQLYSWPCEEGVAKIQPHPLTDQLELTNERISLISSSEIRVSLVTESGGVVTFYDQLLRGCSEDGIPPLISSLSHSTQHHSEFASDPIVNLQVSDFLSFVITKGGKVYWWGLCPQNRLTATSDKSSSLAAISEGSKVRLKNGAPCGPNALVLQCSKTHGPRVGQTVNIIERSSIDPTINVLVKVMRQPCGGPHGITFDSLEIWKQSDIVFLDNSPSVLGKVVAIDNNQAIVDITSATDSLLAESQKSLKVFRLSELAALGPDFDGGDNDSSIPMNGRSLSRHVAGIVQHHPVCLVDPTPISDLSVTDDSASTRSMLKGFTPLAVHPTNSGPYLLVKRIADQRTFIVCTSGTSSALLQSSSFVAVGEKDQKPYKCTMEEESCDAKECAFESWFADEKSTNEITGKSGRKRKHKMSYNNVESFPLKNNWTTASFIDMFNSEILSLRDINGVLVPIPPGLKLKPTQPRYLDYLSSWFPNSDSILSLSFQSISFRQYIIENNKKIILIIAVPYKKQLMPSLSRVDTLSVQRIVKAIRDKPDPSHYVNGEVNTPSKRMALEQEEGSITAVSTHDPSMEGDDMEMDTLSNEAIDITKDDDSDVSYDTSILYECTVHNYNILHHCVTRKDSNVEKEPKIFVPYKAVTLGEHGLHYQSLTAYAEFRQTSFEELRCDYYSNGGNEMSTDTKRDWQDLAYAQLMMLDTFLSCLPIRSHVIKLLCQKNAFGETPFLTALAYQNFTGALKILTFVDELMSSPDADKTLYNQMIMTRNSSGMTPLQIFFASYSTCYDILTMRLYVSSLPLGYSAHQLLSLFKEYYPSVYKVEVTKDYDDDDIIEVEDSTDPESDTEPHPGLAAATLGGITRVPPTSRQRNALQNGSFLDHNIPLRAIVYFSDIFQLRNAHLEMQDFRVFSNYNGSRAGSFNQSHSVSFLAVGLEPEESNEELNEGDNSFPTLLDVGHGMVSRVAPARRSRTGGLRVGWHLPKTPPSLEVKKELRRKKASACLKEACAMLCALLERPEIVTMLDVNGESTGVSLVHNPRCINILKVLVMSSYVPRQKVPLITHDNTTQVDIPINKPLDILADISSVSGFRPFFSNSGGPILTFGQDNVTAENHLVMDGEPVSHNTTYPRKGCSSCKLHGMELINGYSLVENLYYTWPCIATAILGFNPYETYDTPPTVLSSLELDHFVNKMFVTVEGQIIIMFTKSICLKMNEAMREGEDVSLINIHDDLKGMTPSNIPLYVGLRFLGSVVRTLVLEHSRVKGTLVELPPSRDGSNQAANRVHSQESIGRTIHTILKGTLKNFSWLAVDAMAKAAETACLPVRMGVAKPFGANSVTNEYQAVRGTSMRQVGDRSRNRSLRRQFHVRSALKVTEEEMSQSDKVVPILPSSGIRLVPQHRGIQSSQDGYQDEYGMDLSDSENPAEVILTPEQAEEAEESIRRAALARRIVEMNEMDRQINAEFRPDYMDSSSSDDDDPFAELIEDGFEPNNEERVRPSGEDPLESIYPYAWALDGRRIGENTPLVRVSSPSSNMFSSNEVTAPLNTIPSIRFGSGFLARTFSRIAKDIADIVKYLASTDNKTNYHLILPNPNVHPLVQSTVDTLENTWAWLAGILDVAEAQLHQGRHFDTQRYVATLRGTVRAVSPSPSPSAVQQIIARTANKSFIGSTPGEYMMYLIRSQSCKEEDYLPVIDLYGYEHVVYVLDSFVYTLHHWPKNEIQMLLDGTPLEDNDDISDRVSDVDVVTTPKKKFDSREDLIRKCNEEFFRTSATSPLPMGGPFQEAFPLAKQPHLLKPNALKEQLFHSPAMDTSSSDRKQSQSDSKVTKPSDLPTSYFHLNTRALTSPLVMQWSADDALKRWNTAVGVFAHVFLAEGPGGEKDNFLNNRAGFASRMARFRHQVSQLYDLTQGAGGRGEWGSVNSTLSVRVRRENLLEDSLEHLGHHMTKFHFCQIRVKFEDEDGSGPGVNRGFFTSLANAFRTSDATVPPCNKIGLLFYQPGREPEQAGLFAPCPYVYSSNSARHSAVRLQRMTAFKGIGRFIGLCFWFKHTIPFMLCRHVAKFLIRRDCAWHDLAFFNADLYEGLQQMMLDAKNAKSNEEFQATYCCYFEAPVSSQKLSGVSPEAMFKDLIPGGSKIPVTPERVEEYVRLYSKFVMVDCVDDELISMRQGLNDIIPEELLMGLTAEDFQLLLSGDSTSISLNRLKAVMKFNHTHGCSTQVCDRFEKMFWRVVSHMNNTQRQQLLYFATGSASLPIPTDEEPLSLVINMDVIGGSNVESLPVASTCSQRMSIPLYPSYNILKRKLMQAIQCQAYGLG
jgi:E3 ubiquitin-protein ligase EDD1